MSEVFAQTFAGCEYEADIDPGMDAEKWKPAP